MSTATANFPQSLRAFAFPLAIPLSSSPSIPLRRIIYPTPRKKRGSCLSSFFKADFLTAF